MYMATKKIVFKINGDMMEDIKRVFKDPSSEKENVHYVYVKSVEEVTKILTTERLKLLLEISEKIGDCPDVKKLSAGTHRKPEAISRDLALLEKNGLITKTKKGKNVYPKLTAKEIVIRLA